jgi:hypothetical protein
MEDEPIGKGGQPAILHIENWKYRSVHPHHNHVWSEGRSNMKSPGTIFSRSSY